MVGGFTHLDESGRAKMVDVSAKEPTAREAVAEGRVRFSRPAYEAVKRGRVSKGDVPAVARIAGILGAKRTAQLIPLCHPIGLDAVTIDFEFLEDSRVAIEATARRAITFTRCAR